MEFFGPKSTLNNLNEYASQNGTCTGGVVGQRTLVAAPDETTATSVCGSLITGYKDTAIKVNFDPPSSGPSDAWLCTAP